MANWVEVLGRNRTTDQTEANSLPPVNRRAALLYLLSLTGPLTKLQLECFAPQVIPGSLTPLAKQAAAAELASPGFLESDPVLEHLAVSYIPFPSSYTDAAVGILHLSPDPHRLQTIAAFGLSIPIIQDLAALGPLIQPPETRNDTEGEVFEPSKRGLKFASDFSIRFNHFLGRVKQGVLVVANEYYTDVISPWPLEG